MRFLLRSTALVLLFAFTSTPMSVGASGSSYIYGESAWQTTYYSKSRVVTNPEIPGPEVAFYQYSGSTSLYLGTHNCNAGALTPFMPQAHGQWKAVANLPANYTFCMRTIHNEGLTRSFDGHLEWD